jgi:hypothetical protein
VWEKAAAQEGVRYEQPGSTAEHVEHDLISTACIFDGCQTS